MPSIAICIACHNRVSKTLECLKHLYQSTLPEGGSLTVYIFDDGSNDGTSGRISDQYPDVRILKGDGSFFWAGGMRVAYDAAMQSGYDYYVWINDDVAIFRESISRAIALNNTLRLRYGNDHLVIGAMSDETREHTTYSGFEQRGILPPRLRRLDPDSDSPIECTTINGNFVLIPAKIAHGLGSIPSAYIQTLADLDLGYAARRAGFRNWIMPGYAGICPPNNDGRKKWSREGLSIRERLRLMHHPLGYPFLPNVIFNFRNHFLTAPLLILSPYLKLLFHHLRSQGKHTNSKY